MKQTAVEWLVETLELSNTSKQYQAEIEQAKEMEKQQKLDASNVNRVEVIQHSEAINGRAYVNNNAKDVEIQFQDNNKTLKIFLK
jgi:DNA-binding helix-hairpin-helix protein with protein kinase domain